MIAGEKAVVVDAVVDDVQAALRDAEEVLDVAGGAVADGDDFLLAAGERFHDDAAVEHAGEIVFPLHMERREVVDGADGGARRAADEAAVAGDVEDIELQIRGEFWQGELVPEDVFHRRRSGARARG